MDSETHAPGEVFDAPFGATTFRDWELADLLGLLALTKRS